MPSDARAARRMKYAEALLDDDAYRQNLQTRLRAGMCAPALEVLLHQYLYGKPVDEIQLTTSNDLSTKTDEELRDRLKAITDAVSQYSTH